MPGLYQDNFSKKLATFIEIHLESQTNCKTKSLALEFFQISIVECETSISLDASSLFTMVHVGEIVSHCCDLLEERGLLSECMGESTFRDLCLLATTNVPLMEADAEFHRQTDDVAMGSPLCP